MNEQDIPIHIHTNKLLEWLTSRRHCSKNWQENVLLVREKISAAIQDMPAHEEIVRLLSGSHINYFHCLKIVEVLKETEADTKNMFGRYGSKRMKDWQEIVSLYERDNLYLAEAAQILMRNVSYEVPALKKQVSKLEQMHMDCNKKASDYAKTEAHLRSEFAKACKQLGISGDNIRSELTKLPNDLPGIYDSVAQTVKTVQPTVDFYQTFVGFHGVKNNENCLPLLKYIIDHGNCTTYEWTYGEKPVSVEEPTVSPPEAEADVNADRIDFGDDNQIDFGVNNEIDFGDGGEIDWGNPVDENVGEIDLSISLDESGIVVEGAGIDGGVATGTDALTILDNPKTRAQFLDNLVELESFLKIRIFELSNEDGVSFISQMQDMPSALQVQTVDSITEMLTAVQEVIDSMTNKRVSHLHNIKHSPKYVNILAADLMQKLKAADRTAEIRTKVLSKAEEAKQEAAGIRPTIDLVVAKTKELQKQIESEISKKYNNRHVSIVGGVMAV